MKCLFHRACRSGVLALIAVTLTLAWTPSNAAAATGIDSVLVSQIPGYQSNVTGDDGPIDKSELSTTGMESDELKELADADLFRRSFRSDDGTGLAFLIAAHTSHDNIGRTGFASGATESAKKSGWTPIVTVSSLRKS